MVDSMAGVAKDNLRSRAEGSEASAFGMHQADAGSDAYDRDFALSLLSQEQDALYEIDQDMAKVAKKPYTITSYFAAAWPDFIRNQVAPFSPTPVYLGIGNHELVAPKTRQVPSGICK